MKTLIIFYSYTGNTRRIAQELAAREAFDITEIKYSRRHGKLAVVAGCLAAMRGKAWPIGPLGAELSDYDTLILFSPVWAGNPPPAVNAALELIPAGKRVEIKMVSASGTCSCQERIRCIVSAKGSAVTGFENLCSRQ